jgi:hypothetical protein
MYRTRHTNNAQAIQKDNHVFVLLKRGADAKN